MRIKRRIVIWEENKRQRRGCDRSTTGFLSESRTVSTGVRELSLSRYNHQGGNYLMHDVVQGASLFTSHQLRHNRRICFAFLTPIERTLWENVWMLHKSGRSNDFLMAGNVAQFFVYCALPWPSKMTSNSIHALDYFPCCYPSHDCRLKFQLNI